MKTSHLMVDFTGRDYLKAVQEDGVLFCPFCGQDLQLTATTSETTDHLELREYTCVQCTAQIALEVGFVAVRRTLPPGSKDDPELTEWVSLEPHAEARQQAREWLLAHNEGGEIEDETEQSITVYTPSEDGGHFWEEVDFINGLIRDGCSRSRYICREDASTEWRRWNPEEVERC